MTTMEKEAESAADWQAHVFELHRQVVAAETAWLKAKRETKGLKLEYLELLEKLVAATDEEKVVPPLFRQPGGSNLDGSGEHHPFEAGGDGENTPQSRCRRCGRVAWDMIHVDQEEDAEAIQAAERLAAAAEGAAEPVPEGTPIRELVGEHLGPKSVRKLEILLDKQGIRTVEDLNERMKTHVAGCYQSLLDLEIPAGDAQDVLDAMFVWRNATGRDLDEHRAAETAAAGRGLVEVFEEAGLSYALVAKIHAHLPGVQTVGELRRWLESDDGYGVPGVPRRPCHAPRANRLIDVPGIGERQAAKIMKAIGGTGRKDAEGTTNE